MKDTYTCGWCGHNGTKIEEQVASIDYAVIPPKKRYVCWVCGMEVFRDK